MKIEFESIVFFLAFACLPINPNHQEPEQKGNESAAMVVRNESTGFIKVRDGFIEIKAHLNHVQLGDSELSYEEASRFFEVLFDKQNRDIVIYDLEKASNASLERLLKQFMEIKVKKSFSIVVFPCKPGFNSRSPTVSDLAKQFLLTGEIDLNPKPIESGLDGLRLKIQRPEDFEGPRKDEGER